MKFSSLKGTSFISNLDFRDRKCIGILTLFYSILAFINLGSLSFPVTVWNSEPNETVTIEFEEKVDLQNIWINGNIGTGTLTFSADDGGFYSYEQKYDGMFSWQIISVGITAQTISLESTKGNVAINEIAFFDRMNQLVPAKVISPNGRNLLDEQSTVPDNPSYLTGMYFDEIYHARTAYEFLHGMSVYEWTHPPLGKLIICLGIFIFGMKPFGWRFMPALFGVLMLPVMFSLGEKLFRRRDYAFLATALFAVDTMHYAQTRIATVDVFIVFFILLMTLFLMDFLAMDFLKTPLKKLLLPLGLCGLSFGLGVASKWTGLYAGAGLAVLFFSHLACNGVSAAKEGNWPAFIRRAILVCLYCCLVFLLIPGLIYFASYFPFYLYEKKSWGNTSSLTFRDCMRILISQQESMYAYHRNLDATHSCQSAWFEWPFTVRSVWFYVRSIGNRISNISSGGNPAVWWISAVGALGLAVESAFGQWKQESTQRKAASGILGIMILASYLPWLGVSRCVFQYHFFPTIPFVILMACLFLQHLEEAGGIKPRMKWIWLTTALCYFILLFPSASGIPTDRLYAKFIEYILPTGVIYHGYV